MARASAPQRLVLRAKVVLAAGRREANPRIARDLGICEDPVRTWRGRFRSLDLKPHRVRGWQRTYAALH